MVESLFLVKIMGRDYKSRRADYKSRGADDFNLTGNREKRLPVRIEIGGYFHLLLVETFIIQKECVFLHPN